MLSSTLFGLIHFVEDIVLLKKRNVEILIVVSGAVALGKSYLKFKKKKIEDSRKTSLCCLRSSNFNE